MTNTNKFIKSLIEERILEDIKSESVKVCTNGLFEDGNIDLEVDVDLVNEEVNFKINHFNGSHQVAYEYLNYAFNTKLYLRTGKISLNRQYIDQVYDENSHDNLILPVYSILNYNTLLQLVRISNKYYYVPILGFNNSNVSSLEALNEEIKDEYEKSLLNVKNNGEIELLTFKK